MSDMSDQSWEDEDETASWEQDTSADDAAQAGEDQEETEDWEEDKG